MTVWPSFMKQQLTSPLPNHHHPYTRPATTIAKYFWFLAASSTFHNLSLLADFLSRCPTTTVKYSLYQPHQPPQCSCLNVRWSNWITQVLNRSGQIWLSHYESCHLEAWTKFIDGLRLILYVWEIFMEGILFQDCYISWGVGWVGILWWWNQCWVCKSKQVETWIYEGGPPKKKKDKKEVSRGIENFVVRQRYMVL